MRSFLTIALLLISLAGFAQSGEDVVGGSKPITWLGLDFTKTRFIGVANQFRDAGEINGAQVRDKYAPGWNQLFLDEPKKFDIPKAVRRESVQYAIDVTGKANNKIGEDFFTSDPSAYEHLSEADIKSAVKAYDFKGKTGVGLIIFIEGMYKGRDEAAGWITYVDMGKKTVLRSFRSTAKPGGFGFRNYWAKAFLNILKDADRR
jgi:hypothetical protein